MRKRAGQGLHVMIWDCGDKGSWQQGQRKDCAGSGTLLTSQGMGPPWQREKEFPATVMVMVEGACSLRECALHWLWWWKWHPEAVRYKKSEQDWLLCKGWSKAMIGKEKGHCEF
eukprot:scaffold90581_cov20-Tisochrysis_lutea.AAC.1